MVKDCRWIGIVLVLLASVLVASGLVACVREKPAVTEEKTVYVGPTLVDCVGVGPQKCMLLKENPEDEYSMFYDQIEGFDYKEGYEYKLQVQVETIPDPPADASSLRYTLIEVVSKEPASMENTIYVGPVLVDCEGEGPQKCMLVKENPEDEYSFFYNPIEGFDHEEGYEYELRVQVDPVSDPPAGASSLRYTLIEVVSKEPAAMEKTIYVGPTLVDCVGVGPQKCMLVKENPEDEYTMFYDQIEGFDYEAGYEYELRILVETIPDPPADASSLRYTLIEVADRTPSLEGGSWALELYVDGDGQATEVIADAEVTAEFREGQLTGKAGCNQYSGSYEVTGDQLTTGPLAVTGMFCIQPQGIMEQEAQYLEALQRVAQYRIAGEQLDLVDGGGLVVLTYSFLEPTPLVGTTWMLAGYNNGKGGFTTVLRGTEITALLSEDGEMDGSAGCNTYHTSYQASGDTFAVGPVALTRKMCGQPEGIMEQENAFVAALESVATYRIQGDVLEMRDAGGSRALGFTTDSSP
jgi:heat shock protein HslJ